MIRTASSPIDKRHHFTVAVATTLGILFTGASAAEESDAKLKEVSVSVESARPEAPANVPSTTESITRKPTLPYRAVGKSA